MVDQLVSRSMSQGCYRGAMMLPLLSLLVFGLSVRAIAQESTPERTVEDAVDEQVDEEQVDEQEDEAERRVVNCMATATPDYVNWGHRYTYWLSGVAEFDDDGTMLPISDDHAGDWIVTITNSRFAPLETHTVMPISERQDMPEFAFPAVSQQEWDDLGQQPTDGAIAVLSYEEAAHGLYLGIRNTAVEESPRQLFQVIHYLDDDYAMMSEVSACFVGPRPMVLGQLE